MGLGSDGMFSLVPGLHSHHKSAQKDRPILMTRGFYILSLPSHAYSENSFLGLNGGEVFKRMMIKHDVKQIFGYPGGAILPVFDAIHECKEFNFTLPRHEQGAGHMAQGYARVSGKPGVVLVTSGPGATNLITPMMDALADGTPMVVFCGQVATSSIGLDGFQEADVLGMSMPCTKWNVAVRDIAELPRRINQAFEIAASGRPGPVLVELPIDITAGILRQQIPRSDIVRQALDGNHASHKESISTIKRAADLINISKRPVLYVGQGILAGPRGPNLLRELAERSDIPVATSLQGLGAFDEEDPKALHMLGLHGSGYANKAIQEADLIIALGARFDDRVTGHIPKFAPKAKRAAEKKCGGIIHFDISPKNINKVVEATEAVVGDCADNLELMMPLIEETNRPEWADQIAQWKTFYAFSKYPKGKPGGLVQPQAFIERLSQFVSPVKDRTIITTGVGQHQMWTAQHFRWQHPRTMITSGGLGTMGYGLPAAIGAKLARPDALVIDIDGDASFNMTLNELLTASQFDIGVKTIVLNNEEQGMVTHLQSVYFNDRFCHSHHRNPDFVEAARAMGVQAERCSNTTEVDEKLKWLLESSGPALLEVMITQKSLSLPMVPAGRALDEFMFYEQESSSNL
ncbi:acetolactate synthase mitochondrial [Penicillium nucicola]|uniref:acetolactate synthase mitochondrial n=1 Tax=Penicillium nucicola TaxID=1850975 RepID=UPI0025452CB3|nr:acetolactate synthase mitochondrial [Penicillium nucicola]KAJ5756891.1 acetolactate synthase mitochondrial [Penicillium nucicola]